MTDRPILFNAPMVRAILAGTKTQTRRVVKGAPDDWAPIGPETYSPTVIDRHGDEQPGPDAYGAGDEDGQRWIKCPYGQPGDRLWVRETWQAVSGNDRARHIVTHPVPNRGWLEYAATPRLDEPAYKWRPSIHMPRWASRITLEVTGVRVERLQDISEADAMAEGVSNSLHLPGGRFARENFAHLWWTINGDGSWEANPWVWAVTFRRITP